MWTIWRAIAGKVTELGPGLQSSTIGGESERGLVRWFEEQGQGTGIPTVCGCLVSWNTMLLLGLAEPFKQDISLHWGRQPTPVLEAFVFKFSPFSAWAHIAQYIVHSNIKEFLHLFASNSCYSLFCIVGVHVALLWPSTINDDYAHLGGNLPSPLLVSTLPLHHSSCYLQESPTTIFLGTLCCREGFLGHHGYTKDRHAFLKTAETTTCCHFSPFDC